MNPMPELIPMLKQLRLSGILDSIETRNRQAIEEKLSYMDFLATIITDEIARRSQKKSKEVCIRRSPGQLSQPEDPRRVRFFL